MLSSACHGAGDRGREEGAHIAVRQVLVERCFHGAIVYSGFEVALGGALSHQEHHSPSKEEHLGANMCSYSFGVSIDSMFIYIILSDGNSKYLKKPKYGKDTDFFRIDNVVK